jgi:hypothetical protein
LELGEVDNFQRDLSLHLLVEVGRAGLHQIADLLGQVPADAGQRLERIFPGREALDRLAL